MIVQMCVIDIRTFALSFRQFVGFNQPITRRILNKSWKLRPLGYEQYLTSGWKHTSVWIFFIKMPWPRTSHIVLTWICLVKCLLTRQSRFYPPIVTRIRERSIRILIQQLLWRWHIPRLIRYVKGTIRSLMYSV